MTILKSAPAPSQTHTDAIFDLWVHQWRGRHARGEMIVVRWADDFVVGFEHHDDAERFWADLRERFANFGLELADEKTRLIEFGRFAARDRKARGLGKPDSSGWLQVVISGRTGSKPLVPSQRP